MAEVGEDDRESGSGARRRLEVLSRTRARP